MVKREAGAHTLTHTHRTVDYKNQKPKYFNAIWSVINFKTAEERLKQAK